MTLPAPQIELAGIEEKLSDPKLWSNPQLSQPLMRDRKRIEALLADAAELARSTGDIEAYFDLAREGEPVEDELEREIESLNEFAEAMETRTLLSARPIR